MFCCFTHLQWTVETLIRHVSPTDVHLKNLQRDVQKNIIIQPAPQGKVQKSALKSPIKVPRSHKSFVGREGKT